MTLSGTNTYTGDTTINSGATLALTGTGSIADSTPVLDNGTFDISQVTTAGASISDPVRRRQPGGAWRLKPDADDHRRLDDFFGDHRRRRDHPPARAAR